MIRILTPHEQSHIKARYFQSILRVAKQADDASALHIVGSLESETTTDNLPDAVFHAEAAAIAAVHQLAVSLRTREINASTAWSNVTHAVSRWVQLLD